MSIVMDATEHDEKLKSVVSDSNYWSYPSDSILIGQRKIELLFDADQIPKFHSEEALKLLFATRRLHILGGSKTESAVADLRDLLGIEHTSIFWIASEKSKPARNVDKRWAGLDPERDIAICITGRVSHSVWQAGDNAANKCGVNMIECDSQGRIVDALKTWAERETQRN